MIKFINLLCIYFLLSLSLCLATVSISTKDPNIGTAPKGGFFNKMWTCTNGDSTPVAITMTISNNVNNPKDWSSETTGNFTLGGNLSQNCGVKLTIGNNSGIGTYNVDIKADGISIKNVNITVASDDLNTFEILSDSLNSTDFAIKPLLSSTKYSGIYQIPNYNLFLINQIEKDKKIKYVVNTGAKGFLSRLLADSISQMIQNGAKVLIIGTNPFRNLDSSNQLFKTLGLTANSYTHQDFLSSAYYITGNSKDIFWNVKSDTLPFINNSKNDGYNTYGSDNPLIFIGNYGTSGFANIGVKGLYPNTKEGAFVLIGVNPYIMSNDASSKMIANALDWLEGTSLVEELMDKNTKENFQILFSKTESDKIGFRIISNDETNLENTFITLYSSMGNYISSIDNKNPQSSNFEFSTNGLSNGVYYIKVTKGNSIVAKGFIVER